MGVSVIRIFAIFGTVSTWVDKALADGVVTAQEAAELGISLAHQLGLPTEINITELTESVEVVETEGEKVDGEGGVEVKQGRIV